MRRPRSQAINGLVGDNPPATASSSQSETSDRCPGVSIDGGDEARFAFTVKYTLPTSVAKPVP